MYTQPSLSGGAQVVFFFLFSPSPNCERGYHWKTESSNLLARTLGNVAPVYSCYPVKGSRKNDSSEKWLTVGYTKKPGRLCSNTICFVAVSAGQEHMYVRLSVRESISISDLLWSSPGKDAIGDSALQPLPHRSIDLPVSVGWPVPFPLQIDTGWHGSWNPAGVSRKEKQQHVHCFLSWLILLVSLLQSCIFQNAVSQTNEHNKLAKESVDLARF